jgi:hypothetical protein
MKHVLSVSLGSPARDHVTTVTMLGEQIRIERRGTNGDFGRAIALYQQFDGVVDAFGVGGIEYFMPVGDRRYYWRDARRIQQAIHRSKVGDGNGVRAILADRAVRALERRLNADGRTLRGMTALKTTAVARYFLAVALVEAGCAVTFGDFMFALELPIPLRSLRSVRALGRVMLPAVTQLPYRWLYMLGDAQVGEPTPKWKRHYAAAEIIAGDYLQIRSSMPRDLHGKIILTNTTTPQDVEDLRARGVHLLVTETPRLDGRSYGTNVVEAILLALMDRPQADVTSQDFADLIARIPLEPAIEELNPATD